MKFDQILKELNSISTEDKSKFNYHIEKSLSVGHDSDSFYVRVKINTFMTKATLETFDINDDFINSIKLLLNDNTCSNLQSC